MLALIAVREVVVMVVVVVKVVVKMVEEVVLAVVANCNSCINGSVSPGSLQRWSWRRADAWLPK